MKMWKTRWSDIVEVEVERISEKSVWINGRRRDLRSSCEVYHETWDAAHAYILDQAVRELLQAQCNLDRARSGLETVKAMKSNSPSGISKQEGKQC